MNTDIIYVPLSATTGNLNLRKKSAKCYVFYCPKGSGSTDKRREVILDSACGKYSNDIERIAKGFAAPSTMISKEIGGKFSTSRYRVPCGTILKVFLMRNRGYGKIPISSTAYLKCREGSAYRRLGFELLDDEGVIFTEASIEGNFDIIEQEQALAEGVFIPKAFRKRIGSSKDIISSDTILTPEKNSEAILELKELINDEGEIKTISVKRRRRSID